MSTPWLTDFSRRCDALKADMIKTGRQMFLASTELQARRAGHVHFANAIHIIRVAEQYELSLSDAETFIKDQQEFEEQQRNEFNHFL